MSTTLISWSAGVLFVALLALVLTRIAVAELAGGIRLRRGLDITVWLVAVALPVLLVLRIVVQLR